MKTVTKKQLEIVRFIQKGAYFFIGRSNISDRIYQYCELDGIRIEIRSDVFSRLIENDLIYQNQSHPYDYVLTEKGEKL